MQPSLLLALKAGAQLTGPPAALVVHDGDREIPLGPLAPDIESALRQLATEPTDESTLAESIGEDSPETLFRWHALIDALIAQGLIAITVSDGRQMFAACEPRGVEGRRGDPADPARRYIQSRFAYLRRDQDLQVVETPRSSSRVLLHHADAARAWHALASPRTVREAAAASELSDTLMTAFLDLLIGIGAVDDVHDDGAAAEDRDPELRAWEFHDLLFHSRTRIGRHGQPYGGVYRFRGLVDPLPAIKRHSPGEPVALPRPDLTEVERRDVTLTRALEERRSRRGGSGRAITGPELGEFLFRVARVKSIATRDGYQVTSRVYPGGGAAYELEIYAAIRLCDGLASGLHHYCPMDHHLMHVRDYDPDVAALVDAAGAMAGADAPQILLILSARFERVTWKYRSMAYAGILKNVGVIYQTMYLVATAMGLAPCALGGGNSDLFARAAGTSFYTETSVGEFMLSGR